MQPTIFEINTWVWLEELARAARRQVTLADVTAQEWDDTLPAGIDTVWLMGVWERSPEGARVAREDPGVRTMMSDALPDLTEADVVGSPYCIRSYSVDARLGGDAGLAVARALLRERGIRLLVDYVPNHVARDHVWAADTALTVPGSAEELAALPGEFAAIGGSVVALGRDPYFPPWTDVVQLNAFSAALREATTRTLLAIAEQADGVRCDMAMLLLNDVFAATWGDRVGPAPADELWQPVIAEIRSRHPHFIFVAEAYWHLEPALMEQGFDLCYDKGLYDSLEHADVVGVRASLSADVAIQQRLVRFLENHDEPRAAAVFAPDTARAAAVVVATVPGALLLHEGQLENRRVRVPVQLGRRPSEPLDPESQADWERVLALRSAIAGAGGTWAPCEVSGWDDNASASNLVAWQWDGDPAFVIVANLSDAAAQGMVRTTALGTRSAAVDLRDWFTGNRFSSDAGEIAQRGLYVDLEPWGCHALVG